MGYRSGPKTCQLCDSPAIGRGLCRTHYNAHRKAGTLDQFNKVQPAEAFLRRVQKSDGCWLWMGSRNAYGYGIFLMPGERAVRAHRYAYELWKGKIADGHVVMHICDNPPCVNPDHLDVGTKLDNNRDAAIKGHTKSGVRHWNVRLTPDQVAAIRDDPRTHHAVAVQYGIAQSTVSRIKSGKRRRRG